MNPQVFRGRTVFEAHRAALEKLGPEAVVLTTRSVARAGIGGWLGGSDVEIAATVRQRSPSSAGPGGLDARFAAGAYVMASGVPAVSSDVAALRTELKGDIRSLKTMLAKTSDSSDIATEIAQLRELVEGLAGAKPRRDRVAAQLRSLGIEGTVATMIARSLKGKGDSPAMVRDELARLLQTAAWPLEGGATMIAVIGPSGVGKTTTAAKLAARARIDQKTVTLVGCDTFRVGAVEQLARYADLIGADLAVARTPDELRGVIDRAQTDVVIVDTSGRSPTADGVESALATSRRSVRPTSRTRHVMLCLPATLRSHDAVRVARRYGALTPTSLVITKIDETDAPAGIVHASAATRLPVSVMCFGQRVPEDIAPATVAALVEYVAGKGAVSE
jgi:flagellar biosynthesis protein FlhF